MAQVKRVDYDQIAAVYDQRFEAGDQSDITEALFSLVDTAKASRVLEVGCGTGYWLHSLRTADAGRYGLDLSRGMLERAARRDGTVPLIQGRAGTLPFGVEAFDLVYCINAIHHFEDQRAFVTEAHRVLRPGGALAVISFDPRHHRDRWYLYDYFPGTYARDLARFPSRASMVNWMTGTGFAPVEWRPVEVIVDPKEGRAILDDPFFQKHGCSQLALLSEEEYAAGRRRVEQAVAAAEADGATVSFETLIQKELVVGWVATSAMGIH